MVRDYNEIGSLALNSYYGRMQIDSNEPGAAISVIFKTSNTRTQKDRTKCRWLDPSGGDVYTDMRSLSPGKSDDRTSSYWDQLVRLALRAQRVDATPSNALIRQCFPGRRDLFGCPQSRPSQGSAPADLTLASDFAFVFNGNRVRLECCVDPLRPPR